MLTSLISDDFDFFVGTNAGKGTTKKDGKSVPNTGNYNNFLGSHAGVSNTTGYYNNFLGPYAGRSNTTGYSNNFLGRSAGEKNTTGYSNNFLGYFAGYANTTGYYNNFIGYAAGYDNKSGKGNIVLGGGADVSLPGNTNEIVIGSGKFNSSGGIIWSQDRNKGKGSNTVKLGDSNTTGLWLGETKIADRTGLWLGETKIADRNGVISPLGIVYEKATNAGGYSINDNFLRFGDGKEERLRVKKINPKGGGRVEPKEIDVDLFSYRKEAYINKDSVNINFGEVKNIYEITLSGDHEKGSKDDGNTYCWVGNEGKHGIFVGREIGPSVASEISESKNGVSPTRINCDGHAVTGGNSSKTITISNPSSTSYLSDCSNAKRTSYGFDYKSVQRPFSDGRPRYVLEHLSEKNLTFNVFSSHHVTHHTETNARFKCELKIKYYKDIPSKNGGYWVAKTY